jgi:putative ubiquitin-RnfH superfamily antitoxin RatB of RatAB toxin-antitoxin module
MCELNSGSPVRRSGLAGIEQAVDPRQQLLGTWSVCRTTRRAVGRGERVHVVGAGETAPARPCWC